jgi:hypothetical protein
VLRFWIVSTCLPTFLERPEEEDVDRIVMSAILFSVNLKVPAIGL